MLSGELYAFIKVIAKNHMHYDITAAICKMKKKWYLTHFIEIFQRKMNKLNMKTGFYLIIMQKFPDSIIFTARCTLDSKHQ